MKRDSQTTRTNGHGNGSSSRKLPVLGTDEPRIGCLTCALCCTYIAIEIDAPEDVRCATEILWYLYHENVSIYWEGDDPTDDWTLQFETRCRNLLPDNKCAIYEQRPMICREYEQETCEVNDPGEEGVTFSTPQEFLDYLRRERRQLYTHLKKKYVPDPDRLEARPGRPSPLAPFVKRFRQVRDRGFPPA